MYSLSANSSKSYSSVTRRTSRTTPGPIGARRASSAASSFHETSTLQYPLHSSWISTYGPSVMTGSSPSQSTTNPSDASASPSPAASTPADIIASLDLPIALIIDSISVSADVSCAVDFCRMTSMYFTVCSFESVKAPGAPSTMTSNGAGGYRHRAKNCCGAVVKACDGGSDGSALGYTAQF